MARSPAADSTELVNDESSCVPLRPEAVITSQSEPIPLRPKHNPGKSLRALIERFAPDSLPAADGRYGEVQLHGMTVSTKDVHPGDLFVAMPGTHLHGAVLAVEAREKGALAILVDRNGADMARASGLPVVVVDPLRESLGEVAAWFYDTAEGGVTLFGVTGTNGKTSTVHMLDALIRQLGLQSGLSSTAQRRSGEARRVSGLTTPEATELHALLARLHEDDVDAAAVEVSAQALSRHRVDGVVFDVAGFTNLSHDHLDDYGDMDSYLDAKAELFTPEHARRAVISLDSDWGERMIALSRIPNVTIASREDRLADWHVSVTSERPWGTSFRLTHRDGRELSSSISVIGKHMAANAALAIVMLVEGGYALRDICMALERDGGIHVQPPGRTERVSGDRGPAVFVDFGHSADAFAKTLDAVRQVTVGRVIMVFGADGDRDSTKRGAMARAALAGSDILIVTDHHPRFEDPQSIRKTLVTAAREADSTREPIEVADPKRAIRVAVNLAHEGDSVLWAGPGHQNYRDIEGVHVPYSARQEARAALVEAGWA